MDAQEPCIVCPTPAVWLWRRQYPREFEKMNAGNEGARGAITANPHNQYLLMAAELGLLGLGLLICLLIQIARAAARLAAPARHLLGCWLFIFAAGCLANSLLLDFSEGY